MWVGDQKLKYNLEWPYQDYIHDKSQDETSQALI